MDFVLQGRFDEGIAALERAYRILPHPNVLYNLGLAHMHAGRPREAIDYLERYKSSALPGTTSEIDALIRSLEEGQRSEELASTPSAPAAEQPTAPTAAPPAARPAEAVLPQPAPVTNTTAPESQNAVYEERVVSASRISQSPLDAPNATAIITAQDIRMSGVTQLTQILRRVAGLEVNTFTPNFSEVSIRGLNRRTSNKVLVLWDGRPIRKDFTGATWLDIVPILVDDIERIEIIRGPASALYGADAFSGVINIITRTAGEGGSLAVARVGNRGQYQGGASFAGRAGEVAYRASAGYVQTENSVLIVGPERVDVRPYTDTPERAISEVLANGDLTYSFAKNGQLSLGGNYQGGEFTVQGLSRLGQVVTSDAHEAQVYGWLTTPAGIRIATNYNHGLGRPSSAWVAPTSVSDASGAVDQRLFDLDVSWSAAIKLLVPQTVTIGASYRYKYIDWAWLDEVHDQHHVGAYIQDVIELARPLKMQIGARIDHHPLLDQLQFSPRGSLIYRFLGEQSLRLSAGRAFRSPSFLESYLQLQNDTPLRAVTAWGKGNDNLKPESITSLELGYQTQRSDVFALEANFYYNWIKDAILFSDVQPFTANDFATGRPLAGFRPDSNAFPVSALSFQNEGATYRQIGGELGLRLFPLAGLDVYANYSIHDTSPTEEAPDDDDDAQARANEQQTSLHKVNSGVQYRAPFGLELSADVSWLSPQRWIEQVASADRGVRWQEYPVAAFAILSARIGYRLFAERLELGIAGTNLTFQQKRQHPLGQPFDTRMLATAKVRF
jgi:iron complex outermembrane receptor protein